MSETDSAFTRFAGRVSGSGVISANLAVALFGLSGVIGKSTGLWAPLIVFGRCAFGAVAILLVLVLTKRSIVVRRSQLMLLVAQGVILAVHWGTFFQAINVGGVAIGLLAFSTFPFFVAMLEPIVLRRPPTRYELIGSAVILVGVYVLVPSFSLENNVAKAVLWGLASAATFAVLTVFNRRLGEQHTSAVISLYQLGTATVVTLPLVVTHFSDHLVQSSVLLQLLLLGTVCTALAHTIFISSMRHISAMAASVFASLEPVWGIVFAVVLLGDYPDAREVVGGALIVAATMFVATRSPTAVSEQIAEAQSR